MTTFHLTVVTPDGCAFDGQAERVVCRAIDGDLAILAKHGDYCTALGMGGFQGGPCLQHSKGAFVDLIFLMPVYHSGADLSSAPGSVDRGADEGALEAG